MERIHCFTLPRSASERLYFSHAFTSTFELAARWDISSSMPVWQAVNGGFWLACTGIALPLLFYGSVVAMACLSGVAMWWVGWLQPHEFWDYATQRRFPASWFEHTPTF